jgi:hypothetical protein
MATLKARVGTLEQRRQNLGSSGNYVFPSDEEAAAAGAVGGYFVIPIVMEASEWNELALKQQAELVRQTNVFLNAKT